MINDPIMAKINGYTNVDPGTKIQWHVQAVNSVTPLTYGGIYEVFTGNTNAGVANPATGVNRCAVGTDSSLWTSDSLDLSTARELRFRPCPPSHNPTAYTQGTGGTKSIDVHRKNPRLAYEISATITVPNNSPVTLAKVIAEMDEKDMIRQEYITHIQSAPDSAVVGGRGVARVVTVPSRSLLKAVGDMPFGAWVGGGYPYQYLLSDGMEQMWADYQDAWNATSKTLAIPFDPYSDGIRVSSAYRNPERQEFYSPATKSLHMMGRALDIAATGVPSLGTSANPTPSKERGVVFNMATNAMLSNAIAKPYWDYWQLEGIDGPSDLVRTSSGGFIDNADAQDNSGTGIADGYERTGHLHMQDDPTKGNHR